MKIERNLYNLLRYGKQPKFLSNNAARLLELQFFFNHGYKPWDVWANYNGGRKVLSNLDRRSIIDMQIAINLHAEDEYEKIKNQRGASKARHESTTQGSMDPSMMQMSQFQRELFENEAISKNNELKDNLFNSVFGNNT